MAPPKASPMSSTSFSPFRFLGFVACFCPTVSVLFCIVSLLGKMNQFQCLRLSGFSILSVCLALECSTVENPSLKTYLSVCRNTENRYKCAKNMFSDMIELNLLFIET